MRAHYARLFTDERCVSCFEDLAIELQPRPWARRVDSLGAVSGQRGQLLGWRADHLEGRYAAPGAAAHDLRDGEGRVSSRDQRRHCQALSRQAAC